MYRKSMKISSLDQNKKYAHTLEGKFLKLNYIHLNLFFGGLVQTLAIFSCKIIDLVRTYYV